jgi:hypothetical protein
MTNNLKYQLITDHILSQKPPSGMAGGLKLRGLPAEQGRRSAQAQQGNAS